ncbi:MAG: type IV toxin-antitoxin system AbiEi family antitoxin domain-containing protein [Woeseia sp.]
MLNAAGEVVRVPDVVATLSVSRQRAAQFLSRWAGQGWLRRVGPGAYVPVQLELRDAVQVVQDPWVLVPALFDPAYVGGRTAAAHWDLTEQIFRDTLVFTERPLRRKSVEVQGAVFTLKHIGKGRVFGTKSIWRGQSRVAVSDVHRTVIDMLDDPATGGGIQHVADCFAQYVKRKDCNPRTLIDYASSLGNGAVFKRLGFLAEVHRISGLVEPARARMTTGNAKLDPALDADRLITRWRLWVPSNWAERAAE